MAVYDADQHKKLMESMGKGGKSNTELLKTNSDKLKAITPTYTAPKSQKEIYDRTPESTRTALKNSGVDYDNNYNAVVSPKISAIDNKLNSFTTPGEIGGTSGYTLNSGGYGNHYKTQSEGYAKSGNVESDRVAAAMGKISDMYGVFGDWDSGHLDQFIQNKRAYGATTDPNEQARLSSINNQLRGIYNMTEDNYTADDLHPISSDLQYGNFINYGMNKEDRTKIPEITSSDMNIDPKFDIGRLLARRDGMFGESPLGTVSGGVIDQVLANGQTNDAMMVDKLSRGESTRDVVNHVGVGRDGITESTGNGLVNTPYSNGEGVIPLDANNPNAGGIRKSGNGSWIVQQNGKEVEMGEDEYINYMSQLNGF